MITDKYRSLKEHLCTDLLCSDCGAAVAELKAENERFYKALERIKELADTIRKSGNRSGVALLALSVASEAIKIAGAKP